MGATGGAGLSYSKSLDPATLTVEQFILDGGEVIDHLKKRFGVRRIVLLGDSWGGYLVLRMADRFSDNVSFVISVSPAVNVLRSEQKNYFNTLEAAKQLSEDKLLKELESVGPPVNGIYPDGIDGVMVQRQVATQLGGLTLDSSRAKSLMMSLIFADQYTYLESIRYIKGMLQSMNVMLADSGDVDLFTQVTEYKMPVLFVGGAADLYTAPEITQEYFDQIEAPWKQYLLYENAGHFALYELQDSILPVIYEVYDMFGKIHMNDLE
jgi:pimeloyl-ACP methyl ester carboxylesterase